MPATYQIRASKSVTGTFFYTVIGPHGITNYPEFNAAKTFVWRKIKRYTKEASAFSRVQKISTNLLTFDELAFIRKMYDSKCKNITPAQSGWIAGIYERQQREW